MLIRLLRTSNPVLLLDMTKRHVALLAVIGGAAILLAIASYGYSVAVTNEIQDSAIADIRLNTQLQAHALSRILVTKMEALNYNLEIMSGRMVFHDPNQIESAKVALSAAQAATDDLTEFYMWVDQDGRMVWLSDISPELFDQYRDVTLIERDYFTNARDAGSIYYSNVIISNDGIPRMYVSSPIVGADGQFKGILAAGIRLEVLGSYLASQISPSLEGRVGMMDRNGSILYSENLDLIGSHFSDEQFQAILPEELKEPFNAFLLRSLTGGSGAEDISFEERSGTLAYQTVRIDGKDFAVLFVVAQHTFAENVLGLIDQQRTFSTFLLLAIGGVAVLMSIWILSWNSRLHAVVKEKTRNLEETLESLERANERLLEQGKIQKEFINIAAHELRTPIQPLLGIAEQLEHDLEKGSEEVKISRSEIEMFSRNANRLARLSSDILEVSRIESNTLNLHKEKLDLKDKIYRVIGDTRMLVDKENVEVVFETVKEPVVLDADKSRIFEVIANLLRNAINFTKHGRITVRLDKSDNYATISVRDTGEGINPEIMPRLFDKFATTSDQGTGLGLFISKNIVEAHGGEIKGGNNPDGRGATFTFTLPLNSPEQKLQKNDL
jgi:signal transduction histidine kinase